LVCIIIKKETIQDRKQTIVKNSKEEKEFISELRNKISCIDITNIHDYEILSQRSFGTNIPNMSTLLNTLRHSGMRNVTGI